MENKIVKTAIAATIIVILLSSLMIPIISDYSDSTTVTKSNVGIDMAKITDDTDLSITVSGHTATVDGTDYTYSRILLSDRFYILWIGGSVNAMGIRGLDSSNSWVGINMSSATITISGSTITVSGTTTDSESYENTWTIGWGFYLLEDGGYEVVDTADTALYVSDTDEIYSYFTWSSAVGSYALMGSAVGSTATLNISGGTTETQTIEYTTASVDDTDLLSLTFSSSMFEVLANTTAATIQAVVVPATVTGETSGHDVIGILLVLPTIIIVAMLVAIVRTIKMGE